MKIRRGRRLVAAVIAVVAAVVLIPPPAQAHPVSAGSFDMQFSSEAEPQSYIVGANATMLAETSDDTDRNLVSIQIMGANGDHWFLELAAPFGQELSVGTYTGATWPSNREPGMPGLAFFGNGGVCMDNTGSFVVSEITMASPRYLQSIDANFVQYCGGSDDPATGHIVITNPPPPPPLTLDVTIDGTGTVTGDGLVTLNGTLTCTRATDVEVAGSVSQKIKGVTYLGSFATQLTCIPGTTALWETTSVSDGPFRKGTVAIESIASGYDSFYFGDVRVVETGSVRLSRI